MGCPGQEESNWQERTPRLGPGLLGLLQGIKIRIPQSSVGKVLGAVSQARPGCKESLPAKKENAS